MSLATSDRAAAISSTVDPVTSASARHSRADSRSARACFCTGKPVGGFEPLAVRFTRSFQVLRSTAAFLMRAGFLVVWLPLDVCGFRLVLARRWHDRPGQSAWNWLVMLLLTCMLQVRHHLRSSMGA